MAENSMSLVELWNVVPMAVRSVAYVGGGLYACLRFQKLYVEVQIKRRELQQIISNEVESNESQVKPLKNETANIFNWAAVPGVLFFVFFVDLF